MENPVVKVEHLSHRYSVQWAIQGISFDVQKNGIQGLLGSNGAGKSTLMNVLVGERISIATFKAQTTRHRIMGTKQLFRTLPLPNWD